MSQRFPAARIKHSLHALFLCVSGVLYAQDVTTNVAAPLAPPAQVSSSSTNAAGTSTAKAVTPVRPGSIFNANNRAVPTANAEPPLALVGSDPKALDLPECFRMAAVRSDTLLINQQSIVVARAQYSQALAELYPTINFVNSQTFQSASSTGGGSISTAVGNTIQTSGNKVYSSSSLLTVSQTLFNGGANFNNIAAQNANVEAQRYNLKASYLTLYQEVAQSFYQILMSEGDIVVTEDGITALEEEVKTEQAWVHIGRALPSDLLTTQASLAAARVNLEQFRGTLAAARELMAFYLGIPAAQIKLRETMKFPNDQDLEKYLKVLGVRPDILSYVAQVREAERTLAATEGALLPQVSASGSYILTSDPPGRQTSWEVSFQTTIPIFDGGLIIGEIRQQKALTRESQLNLENLRRTDDQNLRTAFVTFNASVAQVLKLREDVQLSALSYNAEADEYKRGVVTNLNLLTALTALQTARQQLNDADIGARLDLIDLHVASGFAPTSLPAPGDNSSFQVK